MGSNHQPRSGKFYRRNEKEVMESLGLKPTKGSGSGWVEKEDGQNEFLMAQLKSTDAQSISVKLDDVHKLEYNSTVAHKIPIFVIQFLGTGELFIMAKPSDLPSVAEYIECGRCEIVTSESIVVEETKPVVKRIINSGNRDKFWEEREKENAKRNDKNKNRRKV